MGNKFGKIVMVSCCYRSFIADVLMLKIQSLGFRLIEPIQRELESLTPLKRCSLVERKKKSTLFGFHEFISHNFIYEFSNSQQM